LGFEQATEGVFSGTLIAPGMYKDINHIAALMDCTPQRVLVTLNRSKNFVDGPDIAKGALSFFEFASIVWPKFLTPLANGFLSHRDSTFS